jgi:cellulose synthase operon protein C
LQRHGNTSGLIVLALVLGVCTCFSQTSSSTKSVNPYDIRFATLQAKWGGQTALERAAAIRKAYGLREYVNAPDSIAGWIASIAANPAEQDFVRDEAQRYRAIMDVHAGRVTSVPAMSARLLAAVQDAVATNPNSSEANEALGLVERESGAATAKDHLERAARLSPSAERWMEAAQGCGDSMCAFSALRSALQVDPTNPHVKAALAEYYLARKQNFKARDLLREAAQTGDFAARKRLGDLNATEGMTSAALDEYRRVEASNPQPLWVRRELALSYEKLGFIDRALDLAQSAVATSFDDRVARGVLIRIYRTRGNIVALRSSYADMLRLNPDDTEVLSQLSELEAGEGNLRAAESLMRRAVAIAPNDEQLRQRFADVLAAEGKQVQEHEQLARILRANAGEEGVRRRLEFERGTRPDASNETAHLVNAAQLAHVARRDETSNATVLADIRIENVQENGLASLRVQQVYLVNTEQGAREYSRRSIQYAADTQQLRIIAARIFKSDGRVVDAEDSGDTNEESSAAMYYDARSRSLQFPGVDQGDVIEIDYRLTPQANTNPYGRYFGGLVMFSSSLPERLQRYVLITPASQQFNIVAARMPSADVREADGRRIYRWEMRDIAALSPEPKGPPVTETAPYVHVSSFSTWQELGTWYAHLIAPQFKLDHALRSDLDRVLAAKNTDQEKIQAIHQFVLRNTHYVALEFGVYGYKPYPVSQVYARRFGDCKDKASLMIALLRSAGIDADIALVRTRRLGDIGEQATSIAIFNHAVVYIPRYDLWLDGTAEYAGSRELPLEDQGAMALTVAQDGSAQLRRIPVTLPMENYTHRQVQARIQPDGKLEFTGSAYVRGEDAPGLRREYEVTERQRDSVRSRLAEVLPSVRVDTVQVVGANDLEHDVTVRFSGEVESLTGRQLLQLPTSWMQRSYVQTLASLPSRNQDLLLPAPWTTEEELHFAIPAGARLSSVPQDKILDTPFGTAVLHFQRQGAELVVTTSVQFRKLRITPSEYGAFRDFCAQVESAFRAEIKVDLKG